jgi:hypothetical protein
MSDFPLIKSLQAKTNKTELPRGHKYAEMSVVVENKELSVFIPEKEVETFENECNRLIGNGYFNKYSFNKIMRKVRGIRG